MMLIAHTLWIVWSVKLGVWMVTGANVLAALGCALVLFTIARHSEFQVMRPVLIACLAGATATAAVVADLTVFVGFATTALTLVMMVPQVVKSFEPDVAGISAATWWMSVASTVSWSSYYLVIDKPQMILPNLVIFPAALIILSRVYTSRKNSAMHVSSEREWSRA
jgi:uncharacterized protein with PQ loop repeat